MKLDIAEAARVAFHAKDSNAFSSYVRSLVADLRTLRERPKNATLFERLKKSSARVETVFDRMKKRSRG